MEETPEEWLSRVTLENDELKHKHAKQVLDHNINMARMSLECQLAIWAAYQEGIIKSFCSERRITVAM